jgi:hypothetical protein
MHIDKSMTVKVPEDHILEEEDLMEVLQISKQKLTDLKSSL